MMIQNAILIQTVTVWHVHDIEMTDQQNINIFTFLNHLSAKNADSVLVHFYNIKQSYRATSKGI